MVVAVIGNGDIADYNFTKEYMEALAVGLVIACDGGLKHCNNMGIKPDYLLGDFDSVDNALVQKYRNMGVETVQFPVKKDSTDIELGLELAFEKNPREILILGGIGTRMDHSLANIHLLLMGVKRNIPVRLVNENNEIFAIKGKIRLNNKPGQIVSLIPITTVVEGITTSGLEYPLTDFNMGIGTSLGVSNVIVENKAEVAIKNGVLLVILARD